MSGHRARLEWMGTEVDTLADLFPTDLRAICVGINPAPSSVTVGHYYQGPQGQRFFSRLAQAGVLRRVALGFDDDAAVGQGFGFTDVVKRPTARADSVRNEELIYGRDLLEQKLVFSGRPTLIFPFKGAAEALVGKIQGNGWLGTTFRGCPMFVMPGPYESRSSAGATIAALAQGLR